MKKGDFLIIGLAALLVAVSFLIIFLPQNQEGGVVTVKVAGERMAEYPLNKDLETEIVTENGKNTLVIKDGFADITSADCHGNDCVHQKKISKNGEIIVCLPHKLVVEITSFEEGENDF